MATSTLKPYDISTEEKREEFIISYMPYVSSVAKSVSRQFNCPELEELKSCGYQGLLEATDNFDPTKNVNFKYYAYIRIYGHMLDYMRKIYAGSNATVTLKRKITKLIDSRQSSGASIDSESLATEMGMTLAEYQKAQDEINSTTFVLNFADLSGNDGETDRSEFNISETFASDKPIKEDDVILVEQLWKIMGDRFQSRETQIMELIYFQDMTYPEIAKLFDITDRRVSQIHLDILARLGKLVKHGRHTKPREHRNKNKTCIKQGVALTNSPN